MSLYMCREDLPPDGHTLYGSEYFITNFVEGQQRTICAKLFSIPFRQVVCSAIIWYNDKIIYNECECWIVKSVPRITNWHDEACQVPCNDKR